MLYRSAKFRIQSLDIRPIITGFAENVITTHVLFKAVGKRLGTDGMKISARVLGSGCGTVPVSRASLRDGRRAIRAAGLPG